MAPEPRHSRKEENGIEPNTPLMGKFRSATSGITPQTRMYLVLAAGTFLFLFSIGYFQVLRLVLGAIGFAMMAWGAVQSGLLAQIISGFNKALSYFTNK